MRIAFVTDTYEEGISGGAVTGVRFVEALRRRHDVLVVATGGPAPGKVQLPGFHAGSKAVGVVVNTHVQTPAGSRDRVIVVPRTDVFALPSIAAMAVPEPSAAEKSNTLAVLVSVD